MHAQADGEQQLSQTVLPAHVRQLMSKDQRKLRAVKGRILRQNNDRTDRAEGDGRAGIFRGADGGAIGEAEQVQQKCFYRDWAQGCLREAF